MRLQSEEQHQQVIDCMEENQRKIVTLNLTLFYLTYRKSNYDRLKTSSRQGLLATLIWTVISLLLLMLGVTGVGLIAKMMGKRVRSSLKLITTSDDNIINNYTIFTAKQSLIWPKSMSSSLDA